MNIVEHQIGIQPIPTRFDFAYFYRLTDGTAGRLLDFALVIRHFGQHDVAQGHNQRRKDQPASKQPQPSQRKARATAGLASTGHSQCSR